MIRNDKIFWSAVRYFSPKIKLGNNGRWRNQY